MTTRQFNRALWLEAAFALLLESGSDAISVQALAKRMKTSRTVFYRLFADRDEVLQALLRRWEEKNTPALLACAGRYAGGIVEAVLNVHDCWFDGALFDSDLENAIRSWSQGNPQVFQVVTRHDEIRLQALAELFQRHGYPDLEADVRARTLYLMQLGYLSTHPQESAELRLHRVAHYVSVFTGRPCDKENLERFISRHKALFSRQDLERVPDAAQGA